MITTKRVQHFHLSSGSSSRRLSAFTLVELLAVVAVVVVLMALTIPAMSPATRGVEITQSSGILTGDLQAARLEAIARNRPVEVRFYKDRDDLCRKIGFMVQRDDGVMTTFRNATELPESLVIAPHSDSNSLSPLLDESASDKGVRTGVETFQNGSSTPYISFRYRPDGSTSLAVDSGQDWFFTIVDQNDLGKTPSNGLNNFTSIQVDPLNGKTRIYRP